MDLTKKGTERKSNAGRKTIFKDDEKGKMFWLLLPESQFENISKVVHAMRNAHLKTPKL